MNIKKQIQKTLILITLFFPQTFLFGNNIQVSNISLTGKDTVSKFTMIQFDISWENSWRTSTLESNWDAAWIFAKYRKKSETAWYHACLNNTGHTVPAGSELTPGLPVVNVPFNATTNPVVGVFLYRNADGIGNVNYTGVQLRWNYGVNGLAAGDSVEVCVYAIEMVYIPTGAFYVGDRVGFVSQSPGHFVAGTTTKPFQITSEAELTIDSNATTELWGISNTGASTIGPVGTLPAQFPKGYQSFYIMKYELSQYMYKEFLNKLTQIQQNARASAITADRFMANTDTSIVPQYRNGIKVMSDPGGTLPRVYGNDLNNNGTEGEADDGQHIACNWLSFYDLMAFADWSGLRPFTELEYEKACRGTLNPTADECAWGTANMTFATGISNPDMANERATNAGANVNSNRELGVLGPMRCGSFAGMATNREQAGATYYGVMEMSGNLWEYAYSVGLVLSRSFNGNNHGDGFIAVSGNTNVADWPIRAGIRGGAWHDFVTYNALQVSSRYSASSAYTSGRHRSTGIRLVRTQP